VQFKLLSALSRAPAGMLQLTSPAMLTLASLTLPTFLTSTAQVTLSAAGSRQQGHVSTATLRATSTGIVEPHSNASQ